jgi:arginine-tRNA-protein transferase
MAADKMRDTPPMEPIGEQLQQYFVDISTGCPYGLESRAVYHQAVFSRVDDQTMGRFFANGYRRNGNCLYSMFCPDCSECLPIRLLPQHFKPNRNQRRVWRKNQDIKVGIAPLTISRENLALLDKYLSTRFPGSKGDAKDYYSGFFITSITRCFEIRYRLDEELVGVAVIDCAADWLNAVYFYFAPELSRRSLGTLNILNLINFCHSHKINYLYLGYCLPSVAAMRYKANFLSHQILYDGNWHWRHRD